jgi:hypothetical protein
LHKGFKCLDPSSGRVYISRDVVFDETVFPFSTLHPNAGARLRREVDLLPDVIKILLSSLGMQLCMINPWLILCLLMLYRVVLVLTVVQGQKWSTKMQKRDQTGVILCS